MHSFIHTFMHFIQNKNTKCSYHLPSTIRKRRRLSVTNISPEIISRKLWSTWRKKMSLTRRPWPNFRERWTPSWSTFLPIKTLLLQLLSLRLQLRLLLNLFPISQALFQSLVVMLLLIPGGIPYNFTPQVFNEGAFIPYQSMPLSLANVSDATYP